MNKKIGMLHSSSEEKISSSSSSITSAFLLLPSTESIDWVNNHLQVKHRMKKETNNVKLDTFFFL